MVEPSGVADGDFAVGADDVVAGAPFVLGVVRGLGFGACVVGLFGCAAAECSVWTLCVVVLGEFVELLLQLSNCLCWWLSFYPAFECLVEAFDFALGLWVSGSAVFLLNAVVVEGFLEGVASSFSTGESCCEPQPLSVSVDAGGP